MNLIKQQPSLSDSDPTPWLTITTQRTSTQITAEILIETLNYTTRIYYSSNTSWTTLTKQQSTKILQKCITRKQVR